LLPSRATPQYGPSGAAVWSSPVVDPTSNTVYFATGNNYTGLEGDGDSVIALDATTGSVHWRHRMTEADRWTVGCVVTTQVNCDGLHDGTNLDYDFGATPDLFAANGRLLIGIGQKSGVYHALDAHTGRIVWQQQVSVPHPDGGESGIQWGTSWDGRRLYVASWQAGENPVRERRPQARRGTMTAITCTSTVTKIQEGRLVPVCVTPFVAWGNSTVDVYVLGPFSAREGGRAITPKAAKPRALLALFAVSGAQVVPAHALIGELWPDRPPRSAVTTLQRALLSADPALEGERTTLETFRAAMAC
jgi:hypothetical protein